MQKTLTGRVALVTGAASGIGRAIALQLAREGAIVSVVDINLRGAKKVVKEIKNSKSEALAIQCDVSNEEQVNQAVKETEKKLGNVGILVNNAGIAGATFPRRYDDTGMVEDFRGSLQWHVLLLEGCY